MEQQLQNLTLKRGLKNSHIQLIALGGAVGSGLFLGITQTIMITGPLVILGYAIGGLIAFLIMSQLGEMVVDEPVSGSIPTWVSVAVFFILINAINLISVRLYGEMKFWFALIKIVDILGMIFFGGYLLASGKGGAMASITNLWD